MAGTTTRGIPYPSPNDPINAYPALAAQAAGIVDALIGRRITTPTDIGQVSIHGAITRVTTDGNAEARIAFTPAFTALITVVATYVTGQGGATGIGPWVVIDQPNAGGFGIRAYAHDLAGNAELVRNTTLDVAWVAFGTVPA